MLVKELMTILDLETVSDISIFDGDGPIVEYYSTQSKSIVEKYGNREIKKMGVGLQLCDSIRIELENE